MTACHRGVRIGKLTREEASSAKVIASNDDLLAEILVRLPIKSLLKFRSVSKHWLSLISDPHFIRSKNLKSNTASALYLDCWSLDYGCGYEFVPLNDSQTRATYKDLTFPDYPHGIRILQSCNGLFSCRSVEECKFFVYNPSTKHFNALPPFRAGKRVLGFSLAFDPSKSHSYKVVCVECCPTGSMSSRDGCQILIYSPDTGSGHWRVSGAPFTAPLSVQFWGGEVYWNGAIHWFSLTDASLYFDLNEELVLEMPLPPPLHDSDGACRTRYFGESGGHLHLVDFYENLTTQFNVYEMERDRSCWFVKFRVDPNGFARSCSCMFPFRVLCVVRGEKEEDSFLVVYVANGMLIRYNFMTRTHQEVCDALSAPTPYGWPDAYPFIESLSLVRG